MLQLTCTDPDCEVVTTVREHPATRVDPAYCDTDECSCGWALDWETAEPVDPEDPDGDAADRAYEMEGDR